MSFTLPWTVNKLVSTNINNADSITGGAYGNVSLKVGGKTQLVGNTVIEGNVGIGTATTSNKLEVSGNTRLNNGTLNLNNTNVSGNRNIELNVIPTSVTVLNFGFSTPAQSANNFTLYTSPYAAITNWTISTVSGTPYDIYVGNSFTALVNNFASVFPDAPLFSQYLSFQGTDITTMQVSQNITFAVGSYFLSFYGWGEYNRYSTSMTLSASCGTGSIIGIGLIEQGWTKITMKFNITTAGSFPLIISMSNSAAINSGCSISGIQIVASSGMIVSDTGTINNQLITPQGLYTNGELYNRGKITNFGQLKNYGPLELYLPYSSGSLVIGSAQYGSNSAALSQGKYNVFIGQSNAVASNNLVTCNFDSLVGIGYGALEQTQGTAGRNIGIGFQANRWNTTDAQTPDNVAIGFQCNQAIGYAGNSPRNVAMGSYVLSGAYYPSADNTVIGHASMSGANFSNGRSFNSVLGGNSLIDLVSNYNSSLGYGNANSIVNTASNNNTFVGSQVCTTQSGASNVLSNCTFLGATSNVSAAGNWSNSTAVGYGAIINANNRIILGRSTETTFAMGGLNIPAGGLTASATQTINFGTNAPTMSGANISATSIPNTALQSSVVLTTGAQTITGAKTTSALLTCTGGITATATQTITFGTNAPTMSGANISATSIPNSALQTSVVLTTGAQTISGLKTISGLLTCTGGITATATQTINLGTNAPTMNGGNIGSQTIKATSVKNLFDDLSANFAFGEFTLYNKTVAVNNCSAFGSNAVGGASFGALGGTSGSFNSGFGASSVGQIESGSNNSGCGYYSLYGTKTGSYNSSVGSTTAYSTDGTNNVFIGYNSGTDPFFASITNDDCTLIGQNTYAPNASTFRTVIGSNATADLAFVTDNSIVLGRNNTDSTYVMKDLYLQGDIRLIPTSTVVASSKLLWLSGVNSASNLSITNPKVIINTSEQTNINTLGTNNTLNIGNSTSTTKVDGPLIVSNNSQKVNGYSTLSGSPNNLSKPLSQYYTLSTASNGDLTLPVIDADMYGSQITFTKLSAAATWTINAGAGNTFRLYKSNSTATATSILMEYNETVLRIVATQSTVWDVIQTDIFYNAAADWVCGTQYFPMLMNPTNITGATNWNTSLPSAFYGIQPVSITATVTLTLPISTNINVPDGLRIKFRRVGGTLATSLNVQVPAGSGDNVMATSSTGLSTTAVVCLNTGTFFAEIYLNKTSKIWYCM